LAEDINSSVYFPEKMLTRFLLLQSLSTVKGLLRLRLLDLLL
jgi:hypothetical protein